MSYRASILSVVLCAGVAIAQSGGPAKGPKKAPDAPEGYTKDDLRGFTLYFSKESLDQDRASKLELKPLEALEKELIVVENVLPADKIKHLKAVPIWVEWDEERELMGINARAGRAVAVFYGGHQANLLSPTKDQRKMNAITILSLRSLTTEHQPKTDTGRCVTLHELAHAFHFFVHRNSPAIIQTYRQAMERKLYDPELYVATNDREYFAELTCAYLDRLDYFPRNRAELKKLDPKGYELMEKTWGKVPERRVPATAKGTRLPSPNEGGKFTLDLTTEDLRLGSAVVGEVPPKSEWRGRPLLLCVFGAGDGRSEASLSQVNPWYADLRDHGLIVVGVENSKNGPADVKQLVQERDLDFPIVSEAFNRGTERYRWPHGLLYDHTGKCVFRGHVLDSELYVRIAVGKSVLAKTGRTSFAKGTQPVVDLLEVGSPMSTVFTKLTEQQRRATGDAASELKQLEEILTAGGQKALERATAKSKDDPVGAFFEAERLPTAYRGTPVEKSANRLLVKLRGTAQVENEMRAKPSLVAIRKLDAQLSGRDRSFNPQLPEFQAANAPLLKQLADAVDRMKKAYPNLRATREAVRIAERWAAGPE
jgi:hypothetical protein